MLEIGQVLSDTSLLTPLASSLTGTASATGTTATATITDSMLQSDIATFLSEFNKLDDAEQQDVVSFLDAFKEAQDEGSDTTALMEEVPDFLKRMLEADVGGDEETGMAEYSSALSSQYQRPQGAPGAGGGMSPEQMVAGTLTQIASGEAGVVDESTDAANSASSELKQLAEDSGANLASLLKQYLDAGLTEEQAYDRVESDLRNSDESSDDESATEA